MLLNRFSYSAGTDGWIPWALFSNAATIGSGTLPSRSRGRALLKAFIEAFFRRVLNEAFLRTCQRIIRLRARLGDAWPTPVAFQDLDRLEGEGLCNQGAADENGYGENQHSSRMLGQAGCGVREVKGTFALNCERKLPAMVRNADGSHALMRELVEDSRHEGGCAASALQSRCPRRGHVLPEPACSEPARQNRVRWCDTPSGHHASAHTGHPPGSGLHGGPPSREHVHLDRVPEPRCRAVPAWDAALASGEFQRVPVGPVGWISPARRDIFVDLVNRTEKLDRFESLFLSC